MQQLIVCRWHAIRIVQISVYNAVKAATKPNIIPGVLAMATGQSRFSLNKPYATHSVQFMPAMKGCINEPL